MLDLAATVAALHDDCCATRLDRDVVSVVGAEAATYLHGQVSQNVTALSVGESAWTLVLSPQGRIDAWARITRVSEDSFWLDVESGFGQHLLERLQRFKLRTKAEFELGVVPMISVRGPNSPVPQPAHDDQIDAPVLWAGVSGFDRIGPNAEWPEGVAEGDASAFEALRIRSGMPSMGAEVGEKTIPAELGIVDLSADFTKGCYVGQELVARIDSRGNNTPRRLWGVEIAGGQAQPGDSVLIGDDTVGVITSAVSLDGETVALASIIRSAEVPAAASVNGVAASVVNLVDWASAD